MILPFSTWFFASVLLLGGALPLLAGPDSVVTINEIHYHPPDPLPPAGTAAPEWIELHNQMSIQVNLGGWSLRGGISYSFPEGTVMEPGAYLLVSAMAGSPPGALGPMIGKLDNGGEEIRLHERWGRMMDRLSYSDSGAWPPSPDGTGPSLAKINPDTVSGPAASWTASAQSGGTPGAENFPFPSETAPRPFFNAGGSWKYEATGADPGPEWTQPESFSDAAWPEANAPLGTAAPLTPPTLLTILPSGSPAYYFRKAFAWSGEMPHPKLLLTGILKGNVECYFNGKRSASPAAATGNGLAIDAADLVPGANLIAIKLTPAPGSPDIVLDLAGTLIDGETAVAPAPLPALPGTVVINEIAYHARPTYPDPAAGIAYAENPAEWIELHNPGPQPIDLAGRIVGSGNR